MKNLAKIYWFAALSTAAIWITVGWKLGVAALFTVIVLTLLEVTFSADNAVVNSKVLGTLSPFWQKLFLTVGIVLAVFVVRFVMPIFIVMMTAHLGFGDVLKLALDNPHEYGEALELAAPFINAFGGTFLLMIALGFFLNYEKEQHWIGWLERRLGKLGQFDNITTFLMLVASLLVYVTVDPDYHSVVLVSSILAMALHIGLDLLDAAISRKQGRKIGPAIKTGLAGFASFMYLQVLDASFSLDGVIGAFAITNSVILIMAGLGAGAVWVRSMTVHLVKSGALAKYVFLEHGAHWAIGFLGAVMIAKLYGVELPEWFVGSIGLVFAGAAVWWSKRYTKLNG
jgi:hypothetical protein